MKTIILLLLLSGMLSACVSSSTILNQNFFSTRDKSQELFNKGVNLLTQNDDVNGAAHMFDQAVAADPTFLRPLRAAAWSYLHLGYKKKEKKEEYFKISEQYAEKLIPLDKETADGYHILAMINYFNNPKFAIENFKHVLDTPPNPTESLAITNKFQQATIYLSMAYAYGEIKDYSNCLVYINKYLSSCQNNSQCSQGMDQAKDIARKIENYLACKQRQEELTVSRKFLEANLVVPSTKSGSNIVHNEQATRSKQIHTTQEKTERYSPPRQNKPTEPPANSEDSTKTSKLNQATILNTHTDNDLQLATQKLEIAEDELDKSLKGGRPELLFLYALSSHKL